MYWEIIVKEDDYAQLSLQFPHGQLCSAERSQYRDHHTAKTANGQDYCQANKDLSVTIRNGNVVLAPADSNDYYQHWIKDMTYGDKIKDANGFPAFALVNRVTGEAFQNPAGENQEVTLVPYNPNHLEDTVKGTEVSSTGFRIIRIADTTSLNLTAVDSNFNFSDGAKIVVQTKSVNAAVQCWNIVPNNSSVPM